MNIETTRYRRNVVVNNSFARFLAHAISFVFHPLFIISYVFAFLDFVHPAVFTGFDPSVKLLRFLTVFFFTTLFPLFAMFLCWRLKLMKSLYLRTAKERIVPYIIVMFFYGWTFWVFWNLPESPRPVVFLLLGSFLSVCGGWMCNLFFKISMHAIAMGGLFVFSLVFSFHDSYASGLYLSLAILVVGLVCTARFIASDHRPSDIYLGFIVGSLAYIASWFIVS